MKAPAVPSSFDAIGGLRDLYRQEMACQIVHDSLHAREGWVNWYSMQEGGHAIAYAAVLVGGPWKGTRTLFEFYSQSGRRSAAFDLFAELVAASKPTDLLAQTNDPFLSVMLYSYCDNPRSEKIVFADNGATSISRSECVTRLLSPTEQTEVFEHKQEPVGQFGLFAQDEIVATGGIATHYNVPYVDLYLEVREDKRGQGFGTYFLQELKRRAYEKGTVPCARCGTGDIPSRRTISKARMSACAHIVQGKIRGQ